MALILKPDTSDCCCPPMPVPQKACPPKPQTKKSDKYFHEVGAEMTGNQLIIRMEKDKNKRENKKKKAWVPPCDCDVIEIKRPTSTKGPRIVNGGDNNQILFRIHSKSHLTKKEDPTYKPQAIAYKINRAGPEEGDQCRKITVYPQLGGPVSEEVYTDHIAEDDQDIYLLRVKKKNDGVENSKKRNVEVELRTPKPPVKPAPVELQPIKSPVRTSKSRANGNGAKSKEDKNGKDKIDKNKNGKKKKCLLES